MSSAIEVLKGNKIEGITIQEINKNNSFNEIISIAQNNYDFLTEQSKNKSISKFNAMRSERLYWKGVRELAEQRKEAIVALEQKESDKGWVCDVCDRETASCLSLCPDCNDRKQGALEELKRFKEIWIGKGSYPLDEMYSIECSLKKYLEKRIKELEKEGVLKQNE